MGDEASGVGADDGGEAMAEWAIEEQTKRTQKEMKNQVRAQAKKIEEAIGEALAREG